MPEWLKHWFFQIFAPGRLVRRRYAAFKPLLDRDRLAQQQMARLETIHHDRQTIDFCAIARRFEALHEATTAVVRHLETLSPRTGARLARQLTAISRGARQEIRIPPAPTGAPLVLALDRVSPDQIWLTGDKAARLAQILATLRTAAAPGFVITTNAFRRFLEFNRLQPEIERRLAALDIHSRASLEALSSELTTLIAAAVAPPEIEDAIGEAAASLPFSSAGPRRFAVRSSAVAEDSARSFAGQYETVLNVAGTDLAAAYRRVIASKYTARALFYRIHHGLSDSETAMAVLVMEMIPARAAGVLYTRDPADPAAAQMHLYSVWGLGELVVNGAASPDFITLRRHDPNAPVVQHREAGESAWKAVATLAGAITRVPTAERERHTISLERHDAEALGALGLEVERLFEQPQDIEWCLEENGTFHILQARPLQLNQPAATPEACQIDWATSVIRLAGGEKAASGIGTGRVVKISSHADLARVQEGSVLVTQGTPPELARVLDRITAVVSDSGSSAGHFASIAREFGIPTLVGTRSATRVLEEGETVTVLADQRLVLAGQATEMLRGSCGKPEATNPSPVALRLQRLLAHVAPLNLIDPDASNFTPEACRTFHDVLRFAHEQAVREMFSLAGDGGRSLGGAVKFRGGIPVLVYLLDLDSGLKESAAGLREVGPEHLRNGLFRAVWNGLTHPDIQWSDEIQHFDWQAFDRLSAGIISTESPQLSSYALIGADYLNFNLRFGYHFVVLDAFRGPNEDANYISLRFKGGGGTRYNQTLRLKFLERVLAAHDFGVRLEGDLIDAWLRRRRADTIEDQLEMIGRLLGVTRLLDLTLDDEAKVSVLVDQFLAGAYRFGPFARTDGPTVRKP